MNAQESLVQRVLEVDYDSFSPELISVVKKSLIDTVGSIIIGTDEKAVEILEKVYLNNQSSDGFTVFGKDYKLPLDQAVIINGTAAHAVDFDDTGASTQGHPSAIIFPSILSLAEKNNANGKKIIESYTVGVEVLSILSRCLPKLHLKGWHPSAILGSTASAAACGKLLGLNEEELSNAISIAASISGGLVANFGTMTKPLHIGKVAYNGVFSSLLAVNGFIASKDIFEGNYGFLHTLSSKSTTENFSSLISTFGKPFSIIDPGINIKLFPSCSLTHRSIDIILDLKKKNNFSIDNISKITCRVTPRTKKVLFYDQPTKPLEGKFSIPFIISCALIYNKVTPELFSEEVINSDAVKDLISKIDFNQHEDWVDEENDWRPDVISVEFSDGSSLSGYSVYPKGHSKNPVGINEIREKYFHCTIPTINELKAVRAFDLMKNLENLNNISELLECLRK